jgi:hypothetical protein
MGDSPIFDPSFEAELLPLGLHTSLLFKALDELRKGTSVTRQYKYPSRPIGRVDSDSTDAFLTVDCESSRDTPLATDLHSGTTCTAVHFADTLSSSIRSTSGRSYGNSDGLEEHQRIGSNPSLTDSIPPGLAEQWLLRSGSLDSVEEGRTTPKVDTVNQLPPLGRNTSSSRSTTPQNGDVAQDSTRSDLSKLRPGLLNAGAHTLKSIRRMKIEVDSEDDENSHSHNHSELRTTISYPGQTRVKSPPSVDGSVDGTEKQQLLSKPSLRPPTYASGAKSRSSPRYSVPSPHGIKAAIKTQHLRVESDPSPSLKSHRPAAVRKRAETAELFDIVSKCSSPSKGHRKKETSGAQNDTNGAALHNDELDSLL